MAVSRKVERELIRSEFLALVSELLTSKGEEVLRVKSNEIAIPVVGCEDNEDFLVVTFKVPTGANKGTEPYDAYAEAESYELKLKTKAEKAKANAEKKANRGTGYLSTFGESKKGSCRSSTASFSVGRVDRELTEGRS